MDRDQDSLYSVLGVEKTSSASQIRSAYRNLAKRWHPDKCSSKEQQDNANSKFQDIQEAYSVLSDDNKRFLYDSGLYNDKDDEGLQNFMGEMATMMSTSSKSSFEELKDLFNEMVDSYAPGCSPEGCSSSTQQEEVFCASAESLLCCTTQDFCIGRQDQEPSLTTSKQRVHKKGPKRRKSSYDQGTRA